MLRRMLCKHPETEDKILKALDLYKAKGTKGVFRDEEDITKLEPTPAIGSKNRAKILAAEKDKVFGPIGLLLISLHQNAARLSSRNGVLEIVKFGEPNIDIKNCPWQFLGKETEDLCKKPEIAPPPRIGPALQIMMKKLIMSSTTEHCEATPRRTRRSLEMSRT